MEDLFLVQIIADTIDKLRALEAFNLDLKHRAARHLAQGQYVVPGILAKDQINVIEAAGYTVETISDLTGVGRERLQEVSRENRFAEARGIPEFGRRSVLGYMTADEVESALINLSSLNPDIVTLIELPNRTWQGRVSRAVRLRAGARVDRIGVLFTGSMHAREWGGSDICITFLVNLVNSYRNNSALVYGGKTFTASQIRTILENLDVFVFPDVNPDGKTYSQNTDPGTPQGVWWRKNRNPNTAVDPAHPGVDVNRNFDFLWNSGIGTSSNPAVNVYKGTSAFSEPESKNVRYLLDAYANIRLFVDIHSFSELMLYSWGDDDNQNVSMAQNFLNPAYDGLRGVPGDTAYREFIATLDENTVVALANRMNNALSLVRGKRYTVQQAVGLYPTSGTSDDYAFSRCFVNSLQNKVYGYTIEFGTEFVPPFSEMQNIISDVCSAITELCYTLNSDIYMRDNSADTGTIPSSGSFWDSEDIWVRNIDDGGTTHQDTIRGQDKFVYVRINNRGNADAQGIKVRVYLANFAGTQFVYPNDWIPLNPAGGGTLAGPGTYLIGETQIPMLGQSSSQVARVRWQSLLIPPTMSWHPCLLVEASPNDGPHTTGNHVWDSNSLAQKNITIVNAMRGQVLEFPFIVGSKHSSQLQVGELVLTQMTPLPKTAGIFLDVKDINLINKLKKPSILQQPSAIPSVASPLPGVGGLATEKIDVTILIPTVVALRSSSSSSSSDPALGATADDSLILRLPAETKIKVQKQGPNVNVIARDDLSVVGASGLNLVTKGDKLLLGLEAKQGRLPLSLGPNKIEEMQLKVLIPEDAGMGDTYEIDVAQNDDKGHAVGGVRLRINII